MKKRYAFLSHPIVMPLALSAAFLAALIFALLFRKTPSVMLFCLLLAGVCFAGAMRQLFLCHHRASVLLESLYEDPSADVLLRSDADCIALAETIRKSIRSTREQDYQVSLMEKQASLSALQSQINPHFLYNTLDGIRSKALMEDQIEIAQMAEKLAVFFRYCISNKEKLVRVREELTHINDYYIIQKFRFGDRFDMVVDIEDESIIEYYMPKMTLQPIVENALHHGIEKSSKKGLVKIHILATDKDVIITVSDNGTGMDYRTLNELNQKIREGKIEKRKKGNGIAMVNISQRIRLTFGDAYGLEYRSLKAVGTDAVIRLPIVNDFSRVNYEKREFQS